MATTIRLTDLQSLLLSHASRSDRHAFEPLPDKLRDQETRVRPCLRSLVKRGLAEVHTVQAEDDGPASEEVLATSAGLEAIGCEVDETEGVGSETASSSSNLEDATSIKPGGRAAQLLELLAHDGGVTIAALTAATGTLPHSVRAALTGLRKKGHAITSTKVNGERRYSVAPGA